MTEREYEIILEHSRPDFADVLVFCWETGSRPQEIRLMKPEYVQLPNKRVIFSVKDSKGKKRRRVIYLTDKAAEIVSRRLEGEWVFVNSRGQQWKASNFNNRLERLRDKVGRKCALYDARHAFGTRKLLEGHPATIVAAWMGHSSPQMLEQHYGHVDQAGDHLLAALNYE